MKGEKTLSGGKKRHLFMEEQVILCGELQKLLQAVWEAWGRGGHSSELLCVQEWECDRKEEKGRQVILSAFICHHG